MKANAGDAYKQAGVDVDAGDALVEAIKPAAAATKRPGVMDSLGGFGAFFDPRAAGYKDPILVAGTDGVGTKLKVAIETGKHDRIGQDLVAMCVNDLIVQGAEPLFFLDYFATGMLNVAQATVIINGIAKACRDSGCALIGGETAEMPGMYQAEDYDLAGFCVGAVERDRQITGKDIREGDAVLGLASSGVHSNGYSLVRKIVGESGLGWNDPAPFAPDQTMSDILLEPTKLYVRSILSVLKKGQKINGLAHITGGGLTDNIPRVLPEGLGVQLDAATWALPPVMRWMAKQGNFGAADMARTFNCGIGMVVIAPASQANEIAANLTAAGETVYRIGSVVKAGSDELVRITGAEQQWID